MSATTRTAPELSLLDVDLRSLGRRVAVAALLAAVAVGAVALLGSRLHGVVESARRGLDVQPGWVLLGAGLELASLAGYVALLALVAGRATPRVGTRESAQITLAGAAATRLLPTAGAGGLGLSLWALNRAGLRAREATRTMLVFLVLLYSVFLLAIVVSGALLTLGAVGGGGPVELSATATAAATIAIALAVTLGLRDPVRGQDDAGADRSAHGRIRGGARLLGEAVREAVGLLRSGDRRLFGAVAYWTFDAAVLWAMLHALGSHPALPVVALAYFVGQVANTVPIPGSVSGGIAGVLIACGIPAEIALPSVLAYRTISVWLPTPLAIAAVPALRTTVTRWGSAGSTASPVDLAPAQA